MTTTQDQHELRERFETAGQAHVFAFWDELSPASRADLLAALQAVDLDHVAELARLLEAPPEHAATSFSPPEMFPRDVRGSAFEGRAREARERGAEDFAAGRVGYLLVAGGQGSRLGFDGPKGLFPAGPVSGASLFELFAHKLRAAEARYGARSHWWIMTSGVNDADTRAFFESNGYFGLAPEQVRFFQQALLPALDANGRIVMAERDRPFLAPNGHGGVLAALESSGGLAEAASLGIERFSYFQVDNPLAHPADPLFVGLHDMEQAEMSTKVVTKRDAGEKVGVIGVADGKLGCIEYSDLPERLREQRDEGGALRFRAGNIAIHVIERTFVESLTRGGELHLPWHLARKKIPAVDALGGSDRRLQIDGVKFETFVFDALRSTTHSVTLEVERANEFSPIKNAEGVDSPGTAYADLCRMWSGWAAAAGRALPAVTPEGIHPVEIDPLVADEREAFLASSVEPEVRDGGHLYRP